ncbi:major facilitator superfamily domain-containing protein [Hirsutella rhossiliensis]|uniref:Major facilitator superfamily domain-containing protein n=1 Tax=Hirsutella rhossiliensis TaxID=111463 RepID=A0A9P8MXN5_9HYPO|nr:major facilitator superfamily domain-containing protein [Hirsutella rhossiliensis]KAH0962294.1 major facilitator superfamily domain-containing protein [Hirsutella rhossiliensis]
MSTDDKAGGSSVWSPTALGNESALEQSRPAFTADDEKRLLRKQDARIIPLSAAIYFLCFLDRANMGNAKILNSTTRDDMQRSLGMTDRQFVVALMVFLVAYAAFEVPSNMLLKKLRPSRWLAFLMFCWGAMTVSLGATRSFAAVTAVRFLLGMFEAGLFPGLVYYLTFWYKHDERSVRVAFVLASATLAGAFGGAIAYGIGHMNGASGLAGWRWLFILEDYPEDANWLSGPEKTLVARRLLHEGSKGHHPTMSWTDAKATLTDWRLYAHYALYFAISPSFASLSLFAPSIVAGLGYRDLMAQLMTVPPWAAAYVCQIAVAYSADHFNARGTHTAGAALVGATGFVVSAALPPTAYASRYGGLVVATSGAFACIPPLLGWLSSNMFSTASTGLAIAINVSIGGGLGQIPGVWIYKSSEAGRGYPTGHWTNAGFMLLVVVLSLGLRLFYGRKNRRLAAETARQGAQGRLYKL